MGLAGRKQKQRIPADPRNLSWADDASRFGLAYLSKFGWDASQGLGTSGNGIKTHLKVQQKLDMMGIGGQHLRDPNGIAWKQNKEFEALLNRLNANVEREKESDGEDKKAVCVEVDRAMLGRTFMCATEAKVEERSSDVSPTKKKRKYENADDPNASEKTRKKQKEKYQQSSTDISSFPAISPDPDHPSIPSSSGSHSEPTIKPRPMAHRARIRAAKRMAGKSSSAISEILGIVSSSSAASSTSTLAPTPTSSSTPVPQPNSHFHDNLTTSAKSVTDYFKEKLLARSSSSTGSPSSSGSITPGLGATRPDSESEPRRNGIGFQVPVIHVPPEVREPGLASTCTGDGVNDSLVERPRRKAERKAEKRKLQEAEGNVAIPQNASTTMKEQAGVHDGECMLRTSKEKKKRKKERKSRTQLDEQLSTSEGETTKNDIPTGSTVPELNKKSGKEHKKKHW